MAASTTFSLCFAAAAAASSSSCCNHNSNPLTPLNQRPRPLGIANRFVSSSVAAPLSSVCFGASASVFSSKARIFTALAAVVDEETAVAERERGLAENDGSDEEEQWKMPRATEVYVCNLPRSCDTEQLRQMFEPHGTILSAEVCRNADTGESRGCAYVTLSSVASARNAVTALDGSDVGGREMRVRFSVEMNPQRRNLETANASPKRVVYYEAPHKLYVGNLARAVRPEELRHLFSKFGNVASVRLLKDQKQGRTRVYAFLSFLSEKERDAALTLNGAELCGRTLVVRVGIDKGEA
ncbi:30S ribosomal protein 2, chloroplastic [Arachis duranensis]|uniref:30S ribosomal protein 2, chloroplastic n=1 Tax=Arachis duranensis TaxID=130453 RepID=A0A6P4D5L5_ARADU|nr:30S ribosomal protein 2, chloroplastic [Arachis duranensis]